MPELHKYSGAGNDFVVLDGRKEDVSEFRTPERISALCDRQTGFSAADGRIGADGLMILDEGDGEYDFRMEYYNSDGSGGMMCGNGGRCIVAFADALGLKPREGNVFRFLAADGPHTGEIIAREGSRYAAIAAAVMPVPQASVSASTPFSNVLTRNVPSASTDTKLALAPTGAKTGSQRARKPSFSTSTASASGTKRTKWRVPVSTNQPSSAGWNSCTSIIRSRTVFRPSGNRAPSS